MSAWTRIGAVDDVPRLEGRSVAVDGRRVAVFRLPGGWAATDAACPHAGGPLGDGIVADSCVTCPLHNRRFDLRTGRQLGGTDAVAVHEVEERDGALWVRLAAARARAGTGAGVAATGRVPFGVDPSDTNRHSARTAAA